MNKHAKGTHRFWGEKPVPKTKIEFFNAVTMPAPVGEGTVATIRMYGPIDSWGGYWGISTKDMGQVLDALPDTVSSIVLRINSPGGEVFEGISILNMLRAHKAKVTAVVDGLAASAASIIAAGCDETVMSPGTQMMIHSPWTFTLGNAAELRKDADRLEGIEASLIEIYQDKAGDADWAALLAEETWYTAAETVTVGLADRVAVIPDAGETDTVGEEEPDVLVVPLGDDEDEDSAFTTRIAAFARTPMPPVSTEPGSTIRKENVVAYDDLKAGFAKRLGVTDADVTDEMLFAALDETLDEQADTPEAAPAAASVTENTVVMDAAAFAELQQNAQLGAAARAEQTNDRRDSIVDRALEEGRIAPASRATWREALDENEERTAALLNTFPKNTVPVDVIGHSDDVLDGDAALYGSVYPSTEKES